MKNYVIKSKGKYRIHTIISNKKKGRERIKGVLLVSSKGPRPKRYGYSCCAALSNYCMRCNAAAVRSLSEQGLKTL